MVPFVQTSMDGPETNLQYQGGFISADEKQNGGTIFLLGDQ